MEFPEIHKRVVEGLQENHNPKSKMFWYGFVTALVDVNQITHEQYVMLRDTIYVWGTYFGEK